MPLRVEKGQFGTFTLADNSVYTGYIASYYTANVQQYVISLVNITLRTVPREGFLLITQEGSIGAISDAVVDYKQIRLKTELRSTYERISNKLDELIQQLVNIDANISEQRANITKLQEQLNKTLDTKKNALSAGILDINDLIQNMQVCSDNTTTLQHIVRAIRAKHPISAVDANPNIQANGNTISITGTTSLRRDNLNRSDSYWLEEVHRLYSIDTSRYPLKIGRYNITLAEEIEQDDDIVYTQVLNILYPVYLTEDDVKATIAALKVLGLLPTI